MKEGLIEVVALIDKSAGAEKTCGAAIAAYNELLGELKGAQAVWSLITFSAKAETVLDRVPVKNAKKLVKKDFALGGKSALFDAAAHAIDALGAKLFETPEEERPSKVIVFIGSAGLDNASKKFSKDEVKAKVEHQRGVYNWEFRFAGPDVYAW